MRTQCFFLCGVAVLCVPAFAFAAVNETIQSRQELLRQQAEQTFPEINQTLEVILRKVNLNQRPEQQRVQEAAEMLEANRRFVSFYESPQKAVYMLLQSWTSYYQEDPAGYLNWAVRACREDASNGDAWITQAVFSCIHGRAPLEPRQQLPERSARVPLRGGRRGDLTDNSLVAQGSGSSPFGRQGILEFDLTKLRRDFLREKFSRQEYQTVDGRKVSYLPSTEDILCLFFWEIEETQADPNLPGRGPRAPDRPQLAETTFGNGQSQHSLEAQQGFFELMSEVLSEKKEVKFVEINTNSSAVAREAVREHRAVAPLVMAAADRSGAGQFVRLDATEPFMAIVGKEGQVHYAGPASGFMPAFILTHLTGVAIDLGEFQADGGSAAPSVLNNGRSSREMLAFDPNEPLRPRDPNQLRPQPSQPVRQRPDVAETQGRQYRQLPEDQKLEAEKQLAYARDFFMKAPRMRVMSYKNGVEICRKIIQNYPDTVYAEEARKLLRQVPERQRERYNITDAELGS